MWAAATRPDHTRAMTAAANWLPGNQPYHHTPEAKLVLDMQRQHRQGGPDHQKPDQDRRHDRGERDH